jgi:hypothetical protein
VIGRIVVLSLLLGGCGGSKFAGGAAAPPPAPSPPESSEEGREADPAIDFGDAHAAFEAANGCTDLCRALGSMRRAVERLCVVDETTERCKQARAKIDAAETKVLETCGGCR